jgi:hypothetical protein
MVSSFWFSASWLNFTAVRILKMKVTANLNVSTLFGSVALIAKMIVLTSLLALILTPSVAALQCLQTGHPNTTLVSPFTSIKFVSCISLTTTCSPQTEQLISYFLSPAATLPNVTARNPTISTWLINSWICSEVYTPSMESNFALPGKRNDLHLSHPLHRCQSTMRTIPLRVRRGH